MKTRVLILGLGVFMGLSAILALPVRGAVEISDGSVKALFHLTANANDSSGNGANGTPHAVSFDANGAHFSYNDGSYISGSDSAFPNGTGDREIVFQVKTTVSFTNHAGAVIQYGNSTNGNLNVLILDNTACGQSYDCTEVDMYNHGYAMRADNVADASFHLVELYYTSSNNTWYAYVDGSMKSSVNPSFVGTNLSSYCIGQLQCGTGGASTGFTGYIRELAVLNRPLTTPEREALYNGGTFNTICVTGGCGAVASSSIAFVFPVEATSTLDFSNWVLNYQYATASASGFGGQLAVKYGFGTTTIGIDTIIVGQNTTSTQIMIHKSAPLFLGNWGAYAVLFDDNGANVANAPTIGFTITNPSVPVVLCNSTSSYAFITNAICDALVFLFIPSTDAVNRFQDFTTSTQNGITLFYKAPFGYFTAVKTALEGLTAGTTTLVLVSTTTLSAFSSFFTPLKLGLGIILWLIFAIWIIHRIKVLDI